MYSTYKPLQFTASFGRKNGCLTSCEIWWPPRLCCFRSVGGVDPPTSSGTFSTQTSSLNLFEFRPKNRSYQHFGDQTFGWQIHFVIIVSHICIHCEQHLTTICELLFRDLSREIVNQKRKRMWQYLENAHRKILAPAGMPWHCRLESLDDFLLQWWCHVVCWGPNKRHPSETQLSEFPPRKLAPSALVWRQGALWNTEVTRCQHSNECLKKYGNSYKTMVKSLEALHCSVGYFKKNMKQKSPWLEVSSQA